MLMLLRMRCVCSVVRWDLCLLAAAAATAAAALVVVPTKQVDRHNLLMVLIAKDSGLTILIVPTCEGILVVRRDKMIHPNGVRHDPPELAHPSHATTLSSWYTLLHMLRNVI